MNANVGAKARPKMWWCFNQYPWSKSSWTMWASAFGELSTLPSSPGAHTPDTQILEGMSNPFRTALLSFSADPAVEEVVTSDFLEMEESLGTLVAVQAFGEELEFHRIWVYHNLLDCPNCDPWAFPVKVCRKSQCHPSHPLHTRHSSEDCDCSGSV